MQATEITVVALRWRAVGSRCVFVDALGDDGIELQLCFADGQLAADELSAGARLRVTARLEPRRQRLQAGGDAARTRGVRVFRAARAERGRAAGDRVHRHRGGAAALQALGARRLR